MTNQNKFSAFLFCAVYFVLAALTPNMAASSSGKTHFIFLGLVLLCYTALPFMAANYTQKKMPRITLRTVALIVSSVSAFGLISAGVTYAFGYKPGGQCTMIQILHGLILPISLSALYLATKPGTSSSFLLRTCAVLYFLNSWLVPIIHPMCGGDCQLTGWNVLGLNLFNISIIVSCFMGFFVFIAVSRALKSSEKM